MMSAWWFWLAVVIVGICIVALATLADYQRTLELRRFGVCGWLDCDLPANGGTWTLGVRYCRCHYDYLNYGIEDSYG